MSRFAVGGVETAATESGTDYIYHAFNTGGTLTVTKPITVDLLLVAGGGAAGSGSGGGGGGGGGGVITQTGYTIQPGTYTISVGQGGIAVANSRGPNGGNTTAFGLTAIGGGGGNIANGPGAAGGSGGGGGATAARGSGGAGTAGQGHDGGFGNSGPNPGYSFGGGGGAGSTGLSMTGGEPGTFKGNLGGKGIEWPVGSGRYYGGGGNGFNIHYDYNNNAGFEPDGVASLAGAFGRTLINKNGAPNTGSGGGGNTNSNGNGGSGVVMLRYVNVPVPDGVYAKVPLVGWRKVWPPAPPAFNDATGGVVTEYTKADGTKWRVHQFNASGTFDILSADKPFHVLRVGGGGGGGGTKTSNGGDYGAGGQAIYNAAETLTVGAHPVTVGTGGTAGNGDADGGFGNPSVFNAVSAAGGGGGRRGSGVPSPGHNGPNYPVITCDIRGKSEGWPNTDQKGQGAEYSMSYAGKPGNPGVVIVAYQIG